MSSRSRLAALLTKERFFAALGGMAIGAPLAVLALMLVITVTGSNLGLTNVGSVAAVGGLIGFVLGFYSRKTSR